MLVGARWLLIGTVCFLELSCMLGGCRRFSFGTVVLLVFLCGGGGCGGCCGCGV